MALGSVSVGWMFFADQVKDRSKLSAAVLGIASDLANAAPRDAAPLTELAPPPSRVAAQLRPSGYPHHPLLPQAHPAKIGNTIFSRAPVLGDHIYPNCP